MFEAIRSLRVRGAPAIGIAAAMGLVLGIRKTTGSENDFFAELNRQRQYLAGARPTAVNLCWALDRMVRCAESLRGKSVEQIKKTLWSEAQAIRDEDAAACRAIGKFGSRLIPDGGGVLTHCNAGALATAEYGTALAAIYSAHEQGRRFKVYCDETRPLLQGSRLTAWELMQAGVDTTVICDNMAAALMKAGQIQCVIVGADRIAANGDVANKIGTYGLAVLAKAHAIPFYVAAPVSTFDLNCPTGDQIPIEQRDPNEVLCFRGKVSAPAGAKVWNPAFDVTPAKLVTAIVTNRGVIEPVDLGQITRIMRAPST